MTTLITPDSGPKLTGRKVFLIFAAFFGTIAAADAFLITSAIRTWSGTEATSPYKAGQLYNGEIAQARAQAERQWALVPKAERGVDGATRITVDLHDAAGRPLAGRALNALLERPTDKREDREVELVEGGAGSYIAVLNGLAPGQWDLVVDVMEQETRAFRSRTRIILR
jgi:nitrogen fixation protein FixH